MEIISNLIYISVQVFSLAMNFYIAIRVFFLLSGEGIFSEANTAITVIFSLAMEFS